LNLPRHFLCQHSMEQARKRGDFLFCGVCGSFWDIKSFRNQQSRDLYASNYPADRGHFEPIIGANKVHNLLGWLKQTSTFVESRSICEVGFGSGFTLKYLNEHSSSVWGIEAVPSNIEFAANLGIPKDHLFNSGSLPTRMPQPIDLWIFLDSFEHIVEVDGFMKWLKENSTPSAAILLILPRADSFSRRWMKSFWIHRLNDHLFHWSRKGIVEFMSKNGYVLETYFFPWKWISLQTILYHLMLMAGLNTGKLRSVADRFPSFSFPLNFGQLGLVFRKSDG
jgi:hypothetical protein